jgi:hypothetical protein
MVAKNYKGRISRGFKRILEDQILHEPLVHDRMSDAEVGKIFRVVAWGVIKLGKLAAVRRAFEENELDHNNPYCWIELLNVFADAHYKAGKAGRHPHRTKEYDDRFDSDLRMLSEKYGVTSVSALAKYFLADKMNARTEYDTLKTKRGVAKAIQELRQRQAEGYSVPFIPVRKLVDGRWVSSEDSPNSPATPQPGDDRQG